MIRKDSTRKIPAHVKEIEWEGKKTLVHTTRIVAKLKPQPDVAELAIESIVARLQQLSPNIRLLRSPTPSGRMVFACPLGEDVAEIARALSRDPAIAYAEPDFVGEIAVVPSDTRYADQWGPPHIRAELAWDLNTGASNVIIGILDTGISMATSGGLDHPDLDDPARYILGTDYIDGGTPRDGFGHGTHVAGICAAESNNSQGVVGMNWTSEVYVCRVFDSGGFGVQSDTADALEEVVDYAVTNGKHAVINLSARWPSGSNTLKDACKYVDDHGMILCAATGNDSSSVGFPAAYSTTYTGVIAVGSVGTLNAVSAFSNTGPEVTVVAPGENILSTTPTYANSIGATNYDYATGTSMATPHVVGLLSLMWGRHPGFTHVKLRSCLTSTAVKLGAGNFNNSWGFGVVDAPNALTCGDIIFTRFTRFTFTRLTKGTFTKLTNFTFTRLTPFTLLTRFTHDPGPGPWEDRGRPSAAPVLPFIRIMGTVFAPEELEIGRFAELEQVAGELRANGFTHVHLLATTPPEQLSLRLEWPVEDSRRLVQLASQLLTQLVRS